MEFLSNYIGFSLWMTTFTIRIGLTLRGTAALIRVPDGRIAQSVEQWIENPRVGGSIPPPATIILMHEFRFWIERLMIDRLKGSIPGPIAARRYPHVSSTGNRCLTLQYCRNLYCEGRTSKFYTLDSYIAVHHLAKLLTNMQPESGAPIVPRC